MTLVKIVGAGAVVRQLIPRLSSWPDLRVEIYSRSPGAATGSSFRSLRELQDTGHPTFVCCSIDEESLLRQSGGTASRLTVARGNTAIIDELLSQGCLRSGPIFVLTNPSELVAHHLYERTGNESIYALGLSVDRRRYRTIFAELLGEDGGEEFQLGGNHWDRPCLIFPDKSELQAGLISKTCLRGRILFDRLHEMLQRHIRAEFEGYKPPVASGARALMDVLDSLQTATPVSVSGFPAEGDEPVGGLLHHQGYRFEPLTAPSDPVVSALLEEVQERHRQARKSLGQS